jgi:hypothetical protein
MICVDRVKNETITLIAQKEELQEKFVLLSTGHELLNKFVEKYKKRNNS